MPACCKPRKALSNSYITEDKTHRRRPLIFACLWLPVKASRAESDPTVFLATPVPALTKMNRMSQERDAWCLEKREIFH